MRVGDATEASPRASIPGARDGDSVGRTLWREAVDVWLRQVAVVDNARSAQPAAPAAKQPLRSERDLVV